MCARVPEQACACMHGNMCMHTRTYVHMLKHTYRKAQQTLFFSAVLHSILSQAALYLLHDFCLWKLTAFLSHCQKEASPASPKTQALDLVGKLSYKIAGPWGTLERPFFRMFLQTQHTQAFG